jgi:hypothetical protein
MWPLFVTLIFGLFVIVPCWKAVISSLLLEKDPDKWDKWQQVENERRKRRDEKVVIAVNGFLRVMGWLESKLRKLWGAEAPLDPRESPEHFAAESPEAAYRSDHHGPAPAPPEAQPSPTNPRWEPPHAARSN